MFKDKHINDFIQESENEANESELNNLSARNYMRAD